MTQKVTRAPPSNNNFFLGRSLPRSFVFKWELERSIIMWLLLGGARFAILVILTRDKSITEPYLFNPETAHLLSTKSVLFPTSMMITSLPRSVRTSSTQRAMFRKDARSAHNDKDHSNNNQPTFQKKLKP
jgi:hypothetical protein